ncbi:MAG: VTT domain-containing protein [Bryobacteraceae bacterium]
MRLLILFTLVLAFILVPFLLWEEPIRAAVEEFLALPHARAWTAVVLAAVLALDIVLPVPSSIVSTAAGTLLGFPLGAAASLAGMTAGCALGYGLGLRAPAHRLVSMAELERLRAAQHRWGDWMLAIFRPVPVLAEASVLFAGMTRAPFARFLLLTALANLGISVIYAAAGAWAPGAGSFVYALAAALVLPGVAMWALRRIGGSRV